jgi:hypothetical protein
MTTRERETSQTGKKVWCNLYLGFSFKKKTLNQVSEKTDVRDKKRDKKRARKRRGTREAQKKMEDAFARSIGEVSIYVW